MYDSTYDKNAIRNTTYSVKPFIESYFKSDYLCLDLGCGNGRKIIDLAPLVKKYYAIDIDPCRIDAAKEFCKDIKNIKFGVCDNFYLPFENSCFDLASCFMSKCNFSEVARILKNGGYFILETLGANDKREIKKSFGYDQLGIRGRLLNFSQEYYVQYLEMQLKTHFKIINQFAFTHQTTLLTSDLAYLFSMTQEVRNFNIEEDSKRLKNFEHNGQITFEEEKLIFICEK